MKHGCTAIFPDGRYLTPQGFRIVQDGVWGDGLRALTWGKDYPACVCSPLRFGDLHRIGHEERCPLNGRV